MKTLRRLALALTVLLCLSACNPPSRLPTALEQPYQRPSLDLAHDVYIATDRDLTFYQASEQGLAQVRTVPLKQDATVGLGVSQKGVFLWRDGDWFGYSLALDLIGHRDSGERYTYSEFQVASSPSAIMVDLDRKVATTGPDLEVRGTAAIPGIADDIILDSETAYILDPTMNEHYLVKVDLRVPDALKVLEQVKFYEGPESKGTQWIDPSSSGWMVLMSDQLLVFDRTDLAKPPTSIPCRQQFDMQRLDGGGPFRVWKTVGQSPLWALGHDTALAVARLEVTAQGLATAERLELTPSPTPLMSPPFIKRAGSRLYASDGGALWVIDISGPSPVLVQTLSFRYGLHLATIPRR